MEDTRESRPPAPPPARAAAGPELVEQVAIVLALSLLRSAVFSLLSLLEAPVDPSVAVTTFPRFPSFQLTRHVLSTAFNLAPVWLVVYLIRRPAEGGFRSIGLDGDRPARDALWGLGLAAAVAAAGLGLYLGAVELGVNRSVIPVPPEGHWWTVPVIVLG
ncbi:MAG: CPBP family intramembrane metalloprotease domain-containing protein, partial [Actinobacteria bacterium]|nr:CPBP family intramembrane metalloprotease domain-containing protein [Actinomycetota bacterium]